jgi:hypothetical protein
MKEWHPDAPQTDSAHGNDTSEAAVVGKRVRWLGFCRYSRINFFSDISFIKVI